MTTVEAAASALWCALRTLKPTQGSTSRRRSRRRIAEAIRDVQSAVNVQYPAPARRASRKKIKRRSILDRRKGLIDQGYVIVTGEVLAAMAEARIRVVRTPKYTYVGALPDRAIANATEIVIPHHSVSRCNPYVRPAVWAPGWAVYYYTQGKRGSSLLQIRKNVPMIRAAHAAIRLGAIAQAMNGDIRCPGI